MDYYTYRAINENGQHTRLYYSIDANVTVKTTNGGETIRISNGKDGLVLQHHGKPFSEETYIFRRADGKTDTLTLQYNPDTL